MQNAEHAEIMAAWHGWKLIEEFWGTNIPAHKLARLDLHLQDSVVWISTSHICTLDDLHLEWSYLS